MITISYHSLWHLHWFQRRTSEAGHCFGRCVIVQLSHVLLADGSSLQFCISAGLQFDGQITLFSDDCAPIFATAKGMFPHLHSVICAWHTSRNISSGLKGCGDLRSDIQDNLVKLLHCRDSNEFQSVRSVLQMLVCSFHIAHCVQEC